MQEYLVVLGRRQEVVMQVCDASRYFLVFREAPAATESETPLSAITGGKKAGLLHTGKWFCSKPSASKGFSRITYIGRPYVSINQYWICCLWRSCRSKISKSELRASFWQLTELKIPRDGAIVLEPRQEQV